MKKIITLLSVTTMVALSFTLSGQSSEGMSDVKTYTNPEISSAPVDVVLTETAPHLPWIKRTETEKEAFKGQRFNYELSTNREKFQAWASEYPGELKAYQTKMPLFFSQNTAEAFKGQEQDFYYDIKAQYEMIAQLQGWTE